MLYVTLWDDEVIQAFLQPKTLGSSLLTLQQGKTAIICEFATTASKFPGLKGNEEVLVVPQALITAVL